MVGAVLPVEDNADEPCAYVGRRIPRVENRALLTGRGKFIDDLPEPRGCLHAAVLRSPHAHARIKSIDISAALKVPGVKCVVTGADLWPLTTTLIVGFENPMDYRCIAKDKVRFVGEPVAVVCATSRYQAEDALEHIEVAYEPLPAVVDPVEACRDDAPVLHDAAGTNCVSKRAFLHGDVDGAFAATTHRTSTKIVYPRNSITPMETYAMICEYLPENGGYDVISNFQGPFSVHAVMAISLKVPPARLRHRSPVNSGGSFGSKLTIFPYIVLMCVCSRLAGKPVKWIEDRLEHLAAASCAPNRVTEIEAAHGADGLVSALRLTHWDDHGAHLRAPMPAPIYRMHGLSTNAYAIPAVQVTNHIVMTNKCPTGAVRGFGGPQLYFAVERLMHKIANDLGLDPLEVIRRNLIDKARFPYRAPAGALIDSGDFDGVIADAIERGNLAELKQRRDKARAEGRLYGIGYTVGVEPSQSNMGYISTLKTLEERERAGPKDGAIATCIVNVDALGAVSVIGDSVPQGQGHQTALAQIVADELGIRFDDVTVNLETDTQKDNWSIASGNYSCRFAPAAASAAKIAAQRVREKMARIASQTLNVPENEIEFVDRKLRAKSNPDNALEFRRVGGLAHWSPSSLPEGMDPGIRESVQWSGPELTPTTANDEINTSLAYGFIFDFCGVEIDRTTGRVAIDRYVTAHDAGVILNPGLAEGQIGGSFAAAVGAALFEEFAYLPDGSFRSGTFADYLIGTADEIPRPQVIHTFQTPSPYTKTGAKGIGEGNNMTTPVCIANAVADALERDDIQLPLVPARVFAWIHGDEEPPPPDRLADGTALSSRPSDVRTVAAAQPGGLTGTGETLVPVPPEVVWQTLMDPDALAGIIPGCRAVERRSETSYTALASLGVGPVRGNFNAVVDLSDLDPPNSLTIHGQLQGALGSSHGVGHVALQQQETGTLVRYDYEVHLSGTVASVGGRMLSGAARSLIRQVFNRLVAQAAPPADQARTSLADRARGLFGARK